MELFSVQTGKQREFIDITSEVSKLVKKIGVEEGLCLVFVPHSTAGLILNEHEPNLEKDLLNKFDRLAPPNLYYYHNEIDDNARAHLTASLLQPSLVLPVTRGKLVHGKWQQILLCEFDGPKKREVIVLVK